jgi:hypothetical protein
LKIIDKNFEVTSISVNKAYRPGLSPKIAIETSLISPHDRMQTYRFIQHPTPEIPALNKTKAPQIL